MAAWVVRCGSTGEKGRLDMFEANSIAAIDGWWTEDLSQINNQEEIKDELRDIYPDSNNQQLGSWASIIFRFVKEIVVGDLILTPSTTSEEVLIGRCQGDYEYWQERQDDESKHVRSVDWLKKVSRSELSDTFIKSIGRPPTVYSVSKHIDEILALLGEADPARWDAFIGWAKWFYERPEFDEEERDYKLEAGKKLAAVKEAVKNGSPGWDDLLKESFISSNLTGWRIHQPFLDLESSRIEDALRRIWGMDALASLEDRVRSFQELGPFGTPGVMASFLLMADGPTEYPIYRPTPIQNACKLTGHPPCDSTDAWERYSHALDFFDEFVAQASARDLNIRDRLDAQSLGCVDICICNRCAGPFHVIPSAGKH